MAEKLTKKQKKQLEAARKKLDKLRKIRADTMQQMDDPAELVKIEQDITTVEVEIKKIQNG